MTSEKDSPSCLEARVSTALSQIFNTTLGQPSSRTACTCASTLCSRTAPLLWSNRPVHTTAANQDPGCLFCSLIVSQSRVITRQMRNVAVLFVMMVMWLRSSSSRNTMSARWLLLIYQSPRDCPRGELTTYWCVKCPIWRGLQRRPVRASCSATATTQQQQSLKSNTMSTREAPA